LGVVAHGSEIGCLATRLEKEEAIELREKERGRLVDCAKDGLAAVRELAEKFDDCVSRFC